MAILMVRSACPAAWESGEWGICEADCGQQSSGPATNGQEKFPATNGQEKFPATNGQEKFGRASFGQDNGAKQKREATCEAECGKGGRQQRRVICR